MDIERLMEAAEATFWIQRGWYRGTGHERFTSWFARFERQELLGLPDAFRACGIRPDEEIGRTWRGQRDWFTAERVSMVISATSRPARHFPRINLIPYQALAAMPPVVVHSRG